MPTTTSDNLYHIYLLLNKIEQDTAKMSKHVDRVEKHISWVEKITAVFLPSFRNHLKTNTSEDFPLDKIV